MVGEGTRTAVTALLLVVESNGLVRAALADYLRECGYTVLEAASAKEAIGLLQSSSDIRVVLVDIGAPDLPDGFSLVQWIRRERPEIKVAMTAGIVRTAHTAGELCAQGPQQRQPYHHQDLERRIRQLLAER